MIIILRGMRHMVDKIWNDMYIKEENVMEEKQFDEVKYKNDFNKQKYDRINLMVPKGKKDELKQLAKEAGISVNEYINRKIFGSDN